MPAVSRDTAVQRLQMTACPEEQAELRKSIEGDNYYFLLAQLFLINPFFRLTQDEAEHIQNDERMTAWWRLAQPRYEASLSTAPKYVVFCMPKSGSSFVKSSLAAALELPVASLTTVGAGRSGSHFGINSREQELDEFAIARSVTLNPSGFVAQCHTRGSKYLAQQIDFFRFTPILVVRNIIDCLVSFDDMMMENNRTATPLAWTYDTQFSLPSDYEMRGPAERYSILARSYGIWLIAFALSWKRCQRAGLVDPLVLRFEEDILQPPRFVERVATALSLPGAARERLQRYVEAPDKTEARFNVGVLGRGRDRVPDDVVRFLRDYAAVFRDELDDGDMERLIG